MFFLLCQLSLESVLFASSGVKCTNPVLQSFIDDSVNPTKTYAFLLVISAVNSLLSVVVWAKLGGLMVLIHQN